MIEQTENDRAAIGELAAAHLEGRAPYGSWELATRLMQRGHRPHVAVRVAMTPKMIVFRPDFPVPGEDLPRPGLEIAESIERNTPRVVQALLYGTLAERCPREAVPS